VEAELDRLQTEGVVTPVQFSSWAAPIVLIVKSDGNIRICGDYKLTVNQAAKIDKCLLPKAKELFASLAGGTKFSELDLTHAYQQVYLDNSSKYLTNISTHRGLFIYTIVVYQQHQQFFRELSIHCYKAFQMLWHILTT